LAPQVVRSFVDIQITERQNVDNQIVDRKWKRYLLTNPNASFSNSAIALRRSAVLHMYVLSQLESYKFEVDLRTSFYMVLI
jgi:hypothetical protein